MSLAPRGKPFRLPRRPRADHEDRTQRRLACSLDDAGLLWCHVPNEGVLAGGQREGARRRARGVKSGVPDVLIFDPPPLVPAARGAAIELKSSTGTTSAEQDVWLARLAAAGWVVAVCRGDDDETEALAQLRAWGYRV